ncbi:hypothetical protein DPMN_174131 [Dreissena polymorpha]|uniref:Secreted protein n=1 Tax=Dreissena polymorpha TaxID=45954 RepID=A0A9D4E6J6_DREPO|nr:hypothetical protein DPMN_174131 [Dreissena polymorpha]
MFVVFVLQYIIQCLSREASAVGGSGRSRIRVWAGSGTCGVGAIVRGRRALHSVNRDEILPSTTD